MQVLAGWRSAPTTAPWHLGRGQSKSLSVGYERPTLFAFGRCLPATNSLSCAALFAVVVRTLIPDGGEWECRVGAAR